MTEKPKRTYTRKVWLQVFNGKPVNIFPTKFSAELWLGDDEEIVPATITYKV